MKRYIHVNMQRIERNKRRPLHEIEPVITVIYRKRQVWCHSVAILDARGNVVARVKYRPDKPLSTGAVVWIETDSNVVVE